MKPENIYIASHSECIIVYINQCITTVFYLVHFVHQ